MSKLLPLPEGDPRHGTRSTYVNHSCRCDACKRANNEHQREFRETHEPPPPGDTRHGTYSTYVNYNCRCPACKATHRERMYREYRLRAALGLPEGDRRHGTVTGYKAWSCRCAPCKEAGRRYRQERAAEHSG